MDLLSCQLCGQIYCNFIGLAAGIADEDFRGFSHSTRGDRFLDD